MRKNFRLNVVLSAFWPVALVLVLLTSSAIAAPERTAPATEAAVKKAVESWLKGRFTVDEVSKTPMPGIVEVRIGTDILYADEKGRYALVEGQLINLKTGANITANRMEEINKIEFSKLPLDLAMKTVKGDGKRIIAVFEDPYCSFCKAYRKTLVELNNVTIYTFFLPILRAESETVARNAWCAKSREDAWNDWMLMGKEPAVAESGCGYSAQKVRQLAQSIGVSATPTTFFADGRRMQGAIAKDRLEQALAASSVGK